MRNKEKKTSQFYLFIQPERDQKKPQPFVDGKKMNNHFVFKMCLVLDLRHQKKGQKPHKPKRNGKKLLCIKIFQKQRQNKGISMFPPPFFSGLGRAVTIEIKHKNITGKKKS